MTKVSDVWAQNKGRTMFICDFSPPKGGEKSGLEQVNKVSADFISVAYSPGKSVRTDSMVVAYFLNQSIQRGVIFNLACRDMNKLAIQNHLLGAHMLGLDNVLVLQGDEFSEVDTMNMQDVSDYRSTELIQGICNLNQGRDFRNRKLRAPTSFCIGATIDLNLENSYRQALLAHKKVTSGADFLITQTFYDVNKARTFLDAYHCLTGNDLNIPIFYGLQVLEKGGIFFGEVPSSVQCDLSKGRSGRDIALEQLQSYTENGFNSIYVVPPILPGGRRNYEAVQDVLEAFRL
jgi:5,10-methylenetetrahydrofolate reductase